MRATRLKMKQQIFVMMDVVKKWSQRKEEIEKETDLWSQKYDHHVSKNEIVRTINLILSGDHE